MTLLPTTILALLLAGNIYTFTATSYSADGRESEKSNEAVKKK
jgi:hypothetical protein